MAFYATYAVDALVRKSGQSAFTWVPLQGVTQCALNLVPEAEKPAFTQSFIGALTGVSQPLQSLLMRVDTHHLDLIRVSDVAIDALHMRLLCLPCHSASTSTKLPLSLTACQSVKSDGVPLQLLKHMEEQDKLEEILCPRDLAEGSTIIHNIMGGINKVHAEHYTGLVHSTKHCWRQTSRLCCT